jgi:hypothetical protein
MFGYDLKQNESSKGNSNSHFLDKIKPEVIIVPCSNSEDLPFPEFFTRAIKYTSIQEVYLVNTFQRDKDSGSRILKLDYDAWKKRFPKTNIVLEIEKNDDDEVVRKTFKTEKSENGKLFAYVVCVDDKGKRTINTREVDFEPKEMKEKKLSKEEIEFLPEAVNEMIMKDEFETGVTYFGKIMEVCDLTDQKSQQKLINLYPVLDNKSNQYKFNSSDIETVGVMKGLEKRYQLSSIFGMKLPRNNKKKAGEAIKKEITVLEKRKRDYEPVREKGLRGDLTKGKKL